MKKRLLTRTALVLIISAALLSCKKENAEPVSENIAASGTTEQVLASENGVATVTQSAIGSNVILTLQPGNLDGEDAMIALYDPIPSYATTNYGQVIDFPALTWTAGGIPTYRRSLLKFTQLSYIPSNAIIVSVKLTLYGVTDATKAPDCTQGNSFYTGGYSPNNSFIEQLAGPWSESAVTWNTQPATTGAPVSIPTTSLQWNNPPQTITIPNSWVTSWINGANNGVMLQLQSENPYTSIVFGSSEASTASKRPKLVIKYHL